MQKNVTTNYKTQFLRMHELVLHKWWWRSQGEVGHMSVEVVNNLSCEENSGNS